MNIDVKLYGTLRRYRPAGAPGEGHTPFVIALPPALTVADLLAVLNIPDGLASELADWVSHVRRGLAGPPRSA